MKNNDNLKEKEIKREAPLKQNELENISGGTGNCDLIEYIDQELCDGCGDCVGSCPNNAIVADGDKYKIDPDKCVDCSFECESSCHINMISSMERGTVF